MINIFLYWVLPSVIYLAIKWVYPKYQKKKDEEMLLNMKTPKDVAIIHTFPPTSLPTVTCIPWEIKLELFFRMTGINYKKDAKTPFYPSTQKTPWVSYNGEHTGDSYLIMEHFKKKLNLTVGTPGHYTEVELAIARSLRVMLEERWYWAMTNWRFIRPDGHELFYRDFQETAKYTWPVPLPFVRYYWGGILKDENYKHGIGRHTDQNRQQFFLDDLKTISTFLGTKTYILGDEPCDEDCGIFGQLTMACWGLPDSPYEKFLNESVPNLKLYCERIRNKFWPNGWIQPNEYNTY